MALQRKGEQKPGERKQQMSTPTPTGHPRSPSSLPGVLCGESPLARTMSAEGAGRGPERSPPTDCESPHRVCSGGGSRVSGHPARELSARDGRLPGSFLSFLCA